MTEASKHVLFVITGLGFGGAEAQLYHLSGVLVSRGWRVTVVSLLPRSGGYATDLESMGVDVRSLGMRRTRLPDPRAVLRLARITREVRPDVVHSHMVPANILARLARPLMHAPVLISTIHTTEESDRGRRYHRYAYPLTDFFSDLTTQVSKDGIARSKKLHLVPSGRLRYVPNGANLDGPYRDGIARRGIRTGFAIGDEFVWLCVARLSPVKDHPNLLHAVEILRARGSRSTLLLAGDGAEKDGLVALAAKLKLTEHVRFLGLRNDVPALLSGADAFVLPSSAEGMPMVLLEASAAALPIVATDVGAARDVVDASTGILVPPGDPGALADAMEGIEMMPIAQRMAMGDKARTKMLAEYDIELVVDQWERIYSESLDRPALLSRHRK